MSNTWLISDNHFGHANILTFKIDVDGIEVPLRSFSSREEMDEHMIEKWNSVISKEDKVYHLGDFSICKRQYFHDILYRLNGRKVLIKGNHDTLDLKDYATHFYDVRSYHVLDRILLSHIPVHPESISRWKGQVHGHLHRNKLPDKRYMNVSVECIDYTPVNWEEIRTYFDRITPS